MSKEQLQFVLKLEETGEVDFWARSKRIGYPSDIAVAPESIQRLRQKLTQLRINIDVTNTNLQTQINEESKPVSGASLRSMADANYDLAQYHWYNEMLAFADNLVATHPNLIQKFEIGKSIEQRPLVVLKISMGSNVNKKAIWMDFGIHAREWISPAVGQYMLNELATSTKFETVKLLEKFDFYIMPVVNPDGYEFTLSKERFWRKNRRRNTIEGGWTGTCEGVDLNRNFDFNFGGASTSTNGCSDLYRGAYAFSEPETKALSQFILANKEKFIAFFTFHSFSQIWGYPWGHTQGLCPPDVADIAEVAETGVNAIKAVEGTQYEVGLIADILYGVGGASDDWAKSVAGIKYSYVLELRPCGNCTGGFVLQQSKIIPTARETWAGVMAAANKIDEHLRTGGNGLLNNGAIFRTGCRVSDVGFKYPKSEPSAINMKPRPVVSGNNGSRVVCEDNPSAQCNAYKAFSVCIRFSEWARVNCRKTCGYC